MKYAMVLPDGAADEPTPALGGRTPLQAAAKPNMDWIARHGRLGLAVTVPPGFSPGSDVATLSLFGYDPRVDYTGRAPLEAAAQGIAVGPHAVIFRCNFVTIIDGKMADFTAGHISQTEADQLISQLNQRLGGDDIRFQTGVSYRNLMIATGIAGAGPRCTPPHDIPDRPVLEHLPSGPGSDWVRELMDQARPVLASSEINEERAHRREKPATDIWLWGQGRLKPLESFQRRFGQSAAAIAAVDLIRGIAKMAGVDVLHVHGATGYLDTDYAAKGRAACAALDRYDVVLVHVEAPDEAGHQGDAAAKTRALEEIDRHVVGPMMARLREFPAWRILIAPDHPTPVSKRIHTSAPPPFCAAGTGIGPAPAAALAFTEDAASQSGLIIDPGHLLMGQFLRQPIW